VRAREAARSFELRAARHRMLTRRHRRPEAQTVRVMCATLTASSQARNIYRCRDTPFHETMSYLTNHSKQSIYNHNVGGSLEGCRRFEHTNMYLSRLPVRPPRSQPFTSLRFGMRILRERTCLTTFTDNGMERARRGRLLVAVNEFIE